MTDTPYDHTDIVWQPLPARQYTDQLRLTGFNLRRSQPVSRHLTETEASYQRDTLATAGTRGREDVNSIAGACLQASSQTTEYLHQNGVPATVCKFTVTDGQYEAAHYAAVAAPPTPEATPPSVDGIPPNRQLTIVDPTLEQFTRFSFSRHPDVTAEFLTPTDIQPVEMTTAEDPLAPIYEPRTINNDPCPTDIP